MYEKELLSPCRTHLHQLCVTHVVSVKNIIRLSNFYNKKFKRKGLEEQYDSASLLSETQNSMTSGILALTYFPARRQKVHVSTEIIDDD